MAGTYTSEKQALIAGSGAFELKLFLQVSENIQTGYSYCYWIQERKCVAGVKGH